MQTDGTAASSNDTTVATSNDIGFTISIKSTEKMFTLLFLLHPWPLWKEKRTITCSAVKYILIQHSNQPIMATTMQKIHNMTVVAAAAGKCSN